MCYSLLETMGESADSPTDTRAEFDQITSIHVYSLEPGPIEVWKEALQNSTSQLRDTGLRCISGL